MDDFDKNLTEFFKNEGTEFPTKNIGEVAILKFISKSENDAISNSPIKKLILISVCIIAVIIGGTIAVSADARDSLTKLIQNVFTIEKHNDSYTIVEKKSDENISGFNYGGIKIDHFSTKGLIDKIGFKPFIPEAIGSNYQICASVGVTLNGKSSDLMALMKNMNLVNQCIKDDSVFKSMKKYKPRRYLEVSYSAYGNITDENQIIIYMWKTAIQANPNSLKTISKFNYKGVECSYIDDTKLDFQKAYSNGMSYDDETKKPNGFIHLKNIIFTLNEASYSLSFMRNINDTDPFGEFDYNRVVKFIKDYIDAYKAKK